MPRTDSGHISVRILAGIVLILGAFILTSAQTGEVIKGKGGTAGLTTGSTTSATDGGTTGSTSATTTGTSTTGTTGTEDPNGETLTSNLMGVLIEEKIRAQSRYISSGTLISSTDTNRHVVRIKFRCLKTVGAPQAVSGEPGNYTITTNYITAVAAPEGNEIGTDSTMPTVYSQTVNSEPCAMVIGPGVSSSDVTLFNASFATWYCWVQKGASGVLSGGTLKLYAYYHSSYVKYNSSGTVIGGGYGPSNGWQTVELDIEKLTLEGISLDSRRVYGKANLDGELPGDPNAEQGNNNFQPWVFKGGHFVGNMAYGTSKDQSGVGRSQFRLTDTSAGEDYLLGCVSLFATGKRGTFSTGTIGLYKPLSTDTNLNTGLATAWSNRWALAPGDTPVAFTTTPYWTQTTGTDSNNQSQFCNWQIPSRSIIWKTEYGGDGNSTHLDMWRHFGMCQVDESTNTWQYFSSTWNQAISGQQFPLSDSQPRVWKVKVQS